MDGAGTSNKRCMAYSYVVRYLISAMARPLSVTTGVLPLVGVVLELSVTVIGMVDQTTGAHEARDALRDLCHALQNLNKETYNIQTMLRILTDEAVKKLLAL